MKQDRSFNYDPQRKKILAANCPQILPSARETFIVSSAKGRWTTDNPFFFLAKSMFVLWRSRFPKAKTFLFLFSVRSIKCFLWRKLTAIQQNHYLPQSFKETLCTACYVCTVFYSHEFVFLNVVYLLWPLNVFFNLKFTVVTNSNWLDWGLNIHKIQSNKSKQFLPFILPAFETEYGIFW